MSSHARHARMAGSLRLLLVLLSAVLLASVAVITLAPKADAAVNRRAVGPVNPGNGFPQWYQDANGLRMAQCLDVSPLCELAAEPGEPSPLPNPNAGVSFPGNFPDEFVYWAAETSMPVGVGGEARLVMAVEGAFGGADEAVRDGDQIVAGVIVIRANGLRANTLYKITHPYGVSNLRSDGQGNLRQVIESGCELEAPGDACNFGTATQSPVFGGFLRWTPDANRPAGFLGDPEIPHAVVGSPNGTNFFRIEGQAAGGPGVARRDMTQFSVMGKVLNPIPTSINLNASPSRVNFGRATTLSGRLTSSLGGRLSGKRVVILQRPAGAARFTPVPGSGRTTGADGTFRVRVEPRKTTTYRASFGGEANAFWPSTSASAVVRVVR